MLSACAEAEREDDGGQSLTSSVIEYLNNHVSEKLDLNALNAAFQAETGLTCLNYLLIICLR